MEDYIWLFDRREYRELSGSILGSVLFHALLFAVLASTGIFNPLPGDSEKIDILWYYPSMSPGLQTVAVEKTITPPARGVENIPSLQRTTVPPPPENAEPPQSAPVKTLSNEKVAVQPPASQPPLKSEATVHPIVVAPPEEEPEPETEPEMTIPAAIESPPDEKKAALAAEKPVIKKAEAQESKTAVAPKADQAPEETKKSAPPIKKEAVAKEAKPVAPKAEKVAVRPAEGKVATSTVVSNRQQTPEAAVSRTETAATTRVTQAREIKYTGPPLPAALPATPGTAKGMEKESAALPLQAAPQSGKVPGEMKSPAQKKEEASGPAVKPVATARGEGEARHGAAGARGFAFPSVYGDLKLEIVGKDEVLQQIKVVALFCEYARTRRNRPLKKDEAKRVRTLTPKLIRSGESVRQAVIEIAGDGIYEFKVENGSPQPVDAEFAVKLYDNSSKARTKPVGARHIEQSEIIVKILMPEGIFWTDDAAFSGSIEDSESITKFNTDTGLVWKEYH